MIIDAHIHLWNRLHGEDTGIHREALTWGRAREGDTVYYACPPAFHDSLSTYERALAQMECSGVARAVVLQEFMDGKQDDYLAEVRRHEPQRFSCLALFDRRFYEDPRAAFAEAIGEKRLQGFLVKTPDPFPDIVTPALQPVWDACAERGLPVVLRTARPRPWARSWRRRRGSGGVLPLCRGVGPDRDLSRAPAHRGGPPNVTLDSGGLTYRHRYPFPHPKELLHEAVETVGAEKIAWGSDYPRPGLVVEASYQQQLDFFTIECDFLTDAQREAIFSGTALRVYRWEE